MSAVGRVVTALPATKLTDTQSPLLKPEQKMRYCHVVTTRGCTRSQGELVIKTAIAVLAGTLVANLLQMAGFHRLELGGRPMGDSFRGRLACAVGH